MGRRKCGNDCFYDRFSFLKNLIIPESENSKASLFKEVPIEFLRMITVHELAHLKEKAHDKAFYQLCTYMEANYHQYELDCRLYLTQIDIFGTEVWLS